MKWTKNLTFFTYRENSCYLYSSVIHKTIVSEIRSCIIINWHVERTGLITLEVRKSIYSTPLPSYDMVSYFPASLQNQVKQFIS